MASSLTPSQRPVASARNRLWLVAYGLVMLAQLALIVFGLPPQFAFVSTWLVAAVLAVWVWRARGPGLLVGALLLCWVGDVLGNPRLIGIGPYGLFLSVAAFAAANVVLGILFVRSGALGFMRSSADGGRRWQAAIGVLYLVVSAVALAVTWSNLDPALRLLGLVYLMLLVVTATTALMLDTWTGVGAMLFFASHLMVVLEVGGRVDGTATLFRLSFWVLYMLGLLLIAIRMVERERGELRPEAV
ncbi:lysoplasmalogenase family protein [Thermasporomyces composti]|jgi:hypothetical protein|uniref:YhhN-like protein n=1 Tax=Thermasporomyces composti TaxID=696763 RepID=A0A3D9VKZ5_THECX|nr:lysoplasmalogenase family protein [Thermasporomyces composti]REF38051.1 YhhN-like protein [Thermasporomyces composti]